MGYTALDEMRKRNLEKYHIESRLYPEPEKAEAKSFLGSVAAFIRTDCENLRFKDDKAYRDLADSDGKSLPGAPIPLHMQYDLDRLCLERTLCAFLKDNSVNNAYEVYLCYVEMFCDKKDNPTSLLTLLSEFEANASPLVKNHRDHYVHAVLVFAMGLAVYHNSELFRRQYREIYKLGTDQTAACHFLRFWGFTALFHDIGYPFELAYDQVSEYYDQAKINEARVPGFYTRYQYSTSRKVMTEIASYHELIRDKLLTKTQAEALNGLEQSFFTHTAVSLCDRLYPSFRDFKDYKKFLKDEISTKENYRKYLTKLLRKKPSMPESFDYHMDHAFFSAYLMYYHLNSVPEEELCPAYMDALTAIVLHNSLLKYSIFSKTEKENSASPRLRIEAHPLAWLLMLCDEIQCWGRRAYGRKSREKDYPFDCALRFDNNQIQADFRFSDRLYYLDEKDLDDASAKDKTLPERVLLDQEKFLKDFTELSKFLDVQTDSGTPGAERFRLDTSIVLGRPETSGTATLSSSSYLHLREFAAICNKTYRGKDSKADKDAKSFLEKAISEYDALSLEYKLANIALAKRYAEHLQSIHCFYTDKPIPFPEKKQLSKAEREKIKRQEYYAWNSYRKSFGWEGFNRLDPERRKRFLESFKLEGSVREKLRLHDYIDIDYAEDENDSGNALNSRNLMMTSAINGLHRWIQKLDGVHIYSLDTEQLERSSSHGKSQTAKTPSAGEAPGASASDAPAGSSDAPAAP